MNADQKQRAQDLIKDWHVAGGTWASAVPIVALLQELIDAPEAEPVAKVTGYYGGYLSISTIDGRVLPAGTALYLAPPAHSVPDMPLSMEQFGGLVGLARDDASEKAIAYKATNIYGETCYFGVKSTAQAWAKSGSVDEVRLRDLRVVATPAPPESPADLVLDAKPDIWRVMCGDWRDKTVAIHNSAGYITCGLDPAKAAALVRAHNGEMSDGAAVIAEVKGAK